MLDGSNNDELTATHVTPQPLIELIVGSTLLPFLTAIDNSNNLLPVGEIDAVEYDDASVALDPLVKFEAVIAILPQRLINSNYNFVRFIVVFFII